MSVTSTNIGPNTVQITLSGETSSANFITALDAAIVAGGWTQCDVSNQYYRVYSALNADGITSKYIGITIDPGTLQIRVTSYESWNATTHTALNEVWTWNYAGTMQFAFNFCQVIVMVNPRWCILQTFIRNQASVWAGVVELQREAPEDTAAAGYPCWVWICSATVMTTMWNAGNNTTNAIVSSVSFPRTRTNLTGINAATTTSLQTPYARFGATAQLAQSYSNLPSYAIYQWNPTERMIHSTRPTVGAIELHGRMFGLKLTYNIGAPYSQATVPVDSNYAYSSSGTNTNHWVLAPYASSAITYLLSGTTPITPSGTVISQTFNLGGVGGYATTAVGLYFYIATNSGVYKIDASGGLNCALVGVAMLTGTVGKFMQNIVYDNSRYVYAAGPDGVYRIDTLNSDTVTFLATNANGVLGLFWDGTYLWAGIRVAATSQQLFKINPSTYTVAAAITLTSGSIPIAGICSDNQGNTYAIAQTGPLYKIVNSTNTPTQWASPIGNIACVNIYFNGTNLVVCGMNSTDVYGRIISLTDTVLASTFTGMDNTGSPLSGICQIGKLGVYDYYSVGVATAYSSLIFCTDLSGLVSGIPITTQTTYLYSFQVMNNMAVGIFSTTFYIYTNLFRPDDNTTAYGRLLLPQ